MKQIKYRAILASVLVAGAAVYASHWMLIPVALGVAFGVKRLRWLNWALSHFVTKVTITKDTHRQLFGTLGLDFMFVILRPDKFEYGLYKHKTVEAKIKLLETKLLSNTPAGDNYQVTIDKENKTDLTMLIPNPKFQWVTASDRELLLAAVSGRCDLLEHYEYKN